MKSKQWLDKIKTPEDLEWAKNYLASRIRLPFQGVRSADEIKVVFERIESEDSRKLHLKQMKAAWDQKSIRKNNKHKASCLFVISKKAKSNLLWLSKKLGKSQSETLEIILSGTFEHEKNVLAAKKNGTDVPAMLQNRIILPREILKMTPITSPTVRRYPLYV